MSSSSTGDVDDRKTDQTAGATASLYKRSWKRVIENQNLCSSSFRILQFNILADGLSGLRPDRGNFYRAPEGCLDWEYRRELIMEEMKRSNADVLCLEEVDHYSDFFEPILKTLGYTGFFVPKPKSPCSLVSPQLNDGCAIFIRQGSFKVQCETKSMSLRLEANGKVQNQVALIIKLEHLETKFTLAVIVTHLKAQKDAEGENIRVQELQFILNELESRYNDRIPVIIAGDLNATPEPSARYHSLAYKLMKENGFQSAYEEDGQEPPYTTWKIRPGIESKHTIDYIFYRGPSLQVTQVLSIPDESEVEECRIPSYRYGSDHFALAAEFTMAL